MGQTALLALRRKACCGFFRPKNPMASAGFEPAIEELLLTIQNSKLKDHAFSFVRDCLFIIFADSVRVRQQSTTTTT
jgi:hypothetical protein